MLDGMAPLPDISPDAPSGENLEFDPDFAALERACTGKPEAQFGDTVIPATPPEWKEARSLAESLNERTRDLRILALYAQTQLNLAGLTGFAEVVAQTRHLVSDRWGSVHPQLDPEDDNDPTLRSNALFRLQDPAWVLKVLRDLPLASSPMTGPVTWRDIAIFEGSIEAPEGAEKMKEALIRGAFENTDRQRLATMADAVDQLLADLAGIGSAFDSNAGYGTGPDLSNLSKLLTDIQQKFKRFRPAADVPAGGDFVEEAGGGEEAADTGGGDVEVRPSGGARRSGPADIRSITTLTRRDEALHALDLASAYFKEHEPTSPSPMLIDRAKRLATMSFMDVLREMTPSGVHEAQVIQGPDEVGM